MDQPRDEIGRFASGGGQGRRMKPQDGVRRGQVGKGPPKPTLRAKIAGAFRRGGQKVNTAWGILGQIGSDVIS